MKKFNLVEVVGFLCTVGIIAINIASSIVEGKRMDAKIDAAVQAKLTDLMNKN